MDKKMIYKHGWVQKHIEFALANLETDPEDAALALCCAHGILSGEYDRLVADLHAHEVPEVIENILARTWSPFWGPSNPVRVEDVPGVIFGKIYVRNVGPKTRDILRACYGIHP